MPTNPAPRKRNARHIADQAVTLPTKTSIPVCTFDDVFNRRFNDGQVRREARLYRVEVRDLLRQVVAATWLKLGAA